MIEIDKKEKLFNLNLKEEEINNTVNKNTKKRVLAIVGKLKTETILHKQKTLTTSILNNNDKNKKMVSNKQMNKKEKNTKNVNYNIYNEFSDIDSKFIFDKLTNLKKNDNIALTMNYIYGLHFSKKASSNITYNYIVNEILEKDNENIINKDEYIQKIKAKYEIIIYFINKLIEKIEQNIFRLPKSIIYLINISGLLIEKKWNKKENIQKIEFLKSIAKIKILIGNLILPMIKNISSKKIFGDITISNSTGKILKSIKKIFETIIIGKIFDKINDPEYTMYNKFIIETFPKLINIALIIESIGDGLKNENYIFAK